MRLDMPGDYPRDGRNGYLCVDKCLNTCSDKCLDMWLGMCLGMCLHVKSCGDMYKDMCAGMCACIVMAHFREGWDVQTNTISAVRWSILMACIVMACIVVA